MNEPSLIKKNLTERAMDKQKKILIIAMLFVVTLFIGTSYALLTNFDKTDNVITIKSGNLTMTVANDLITLNNNLPESDTDGLTNATPVVITLTNTGTIDIMKYDVKLVKEDSTTNVSTLEEQYIKYAISTDGGTTYNIANILTSNNNIIFTGYNLAVNESKTIYLKTWIDETAKNNAVGKTYYGSIKVDLYQNTKLPVSEIVKTKLTTTNSINEDNITYISGTADDINFNYVWYSGKLWRITAIYPDGTMKMITDDVITTISYGSNPNFYTDNENKSYMYQWLNEDFLDTLYNYENIIVTDSKWNSLTTSSISTKITEGASGVTTITSPVGLLNSYEYYMSYKNTSYSNGYLNISYYWWLLNPYSASNVWDVNDHGYGTIPTNTCGGRPSINLKSGIQLSGGSGTKNDPYTILGDKEEVTTGTTLLNTRSSGEYVKFNNELYRIVVIKNEIIKINKNDYVRDTSNNVLKKKFSTSITYGGGTTDDYWDYYLNNTWYNSLDTSYQNMMVESTYYIGTSGYNYKASICATSSNNVTTKDCTKTTSTWIGLVGLPGYGEMFASQQGSGYSSSSWIWLMNPNSTSSVWFVDNGGYGGNNSLTLTNGGRPSINLKSNIKITGGNGTKDNPFEISE